MIDWRVLKELRQMQEDDEPDIVAELVEIYRKDAPLQIASIRRAIAELDASSLKSSAHTLKSSSANIGASHMVELCAELERIAQTGTTERADALLDQVEGEFNIVSEALKSGLE